MLKDIPPFAKGETWEQWRSRRLRDSVTEEGRRSNREAIARNKANVSNSEQRKCGQEIVNPADKPVFGKRRAA
jgi:hypothetical protein